MPLRVKVDEDLPIEVAELVRRAGHDVDTVVGEGMGGATDVVLWQAAQSERRFLITADTGFGDIRVYPPGTHAGVLLLRPDEDGIGPLIHLVRRVLAEEPLDRLRATVTVASPRSIRVRKP